MGDEIADEVKREKEFFVSFFPNPDLHKYNGVTRLRLKSRKQKYEKFPIVSFRSRMAGTVIDEKYVAFRMLKSV